jgi:hypothetical protein
MTAETLGASRSRLETRCTGTSFDGAWAQVSFDAWSWHEMRVSEKPAYTLL